MAIKTFKPYTPARRNMTVSAFDGVDKKAKPERSLVETLKKNSGRNSYGRITVRHRGGGNKRKYRVIDFKRDKLDMPAVVQRLEYDPNRSAFIALVKYEDGELRYILAPDRPEGRRHRRLLRRCGHQARQLPAHCQHPRRYRHPQRRAEARPRRPAGPLRRHRCTADGQGRRAGSGPSALRRGPLCPHELHAPASARWATSTMRTSTSARPAAPATWASVPPSAAPS